MRQTFNVFQLNVFTTINWANIPKNKSLCTRYKYFYVHVILLETLYWMSSHQNLSIRLISILSFSKLLSFTYCFCQYLLREMKIRFIVSARCTNTVTMDRFPKLAKFPVVTILDSHMLFFWNDKTTNWSLSKRVNLRKVSNI